MQGGILCEIHFFSEWRKKQKNLLILCDHWQGSATYQISISSGISW